MTSDRKFWKSSFYSLRGKIFIEIYLLGFFGSNCRLKTAQQEINDISYQVQQLDSDQYIFSKMCSEIC